MNFRSVDVQKNCIIAIVVFCSYQLSLYTSDVNLQVNLLRCIRHSVDGFEQVSSVDCSGIKGVNFQVSLHVVMLVIFS